MMNRFLGMLSCLLALAGFIPFGLATAQQGSVPITDQAIRDVLVRVADRQLRTEAAGSQSRDLADGEYPLSSVLSSAENAARPEGIEWNYPWGVNLYGLLHAYRATGKEQYRDFVLLHNAIIGRYYVWLRSLHDSLLVPTGLSSFQQSTAMRETFLNDTSAGKLDYCGAASAQFMEGILNHADGIQSEQLQLMLNSANYISNIQARLPDGTLYRPERDNTIWADDLYMSCPFLIRWYRYTGDVHYLDDAALQIRNMAGYLQDADGLWYHGFFYAASSVSGYKWSRANGWAMVATTEVLSVMPEDHPDRPALMDILLRHIEGVKAVQSESGRWHQVLDHPELWEETSSTAMFTYCIARAVNRGWIDPANMEIARRGFAGLSQKVDPFGAVLDVCRGTGIGTTLQFYADRGRPYDDMHGRGALMLAGAEILLQPALSLSLDGTGASISWPAGTSAVCQASTDLSDWGIPDPYPGSTPDWRYVLSPPVSGNWFYRLLEPEPSYPGTPLVFETESLSANPQGAEVVLSPADPEASSGYYLTLQADGTGDFLEFFLFNLLAGTYRLQLRFRSGPQAGRVELTVDGAPRPETLDQYFFENHFALMDFGEVSFAQTGDHWIRMTTVDPHPASEGMEITADALILAPVD